MSIINSLNMRFEMQELKPDGIPPQIRLKVIDALKNDKWDYRTADGIAKELKADLSTVEKILRNTPGVRTSVMKDPNGQELYTLKVRKSAVNDYFTAFRALNASKSGE